ncbi:MAG: hypothetical protein QNJ53_08475 [Pleurocapsa sp. MO_192.B19]|nr:hypothetical protein [Pleurocapsa sp. MO_192.B19]
MLKEKNASNDLVDLNLVTDLNKETAASYSGGAQIENGRTFVGSSGTRRKDVFVNYPDFQSEPSLVLTAEFQTPRQLWWQDAFSVTILEKDRFGARVRVQREDASGGWGQQLYVSWIAAQGF